MTNTTRTAEIASLVAETKLLNGPGHFSTGACTQAEWTAKVDANDAALAALSSEEIDFALSL